MLSEKPVNGGLKANQRLIRQGILLYNTPHQSLIEEMMGNSPSIAAPQPVSRGSTGGMEFIGLSILALAGSIAFIGSRPTAAPSIFYVKPVTQSYTPPSAPSSQTVYNQVAPVPVVHHRASASTPAQTTTTPASGTAPTSRNSANSTKHIFNAAGDDCTFLRQYEEADVFRTKAETDGFNKRCNVPGIQPIID